MLYFAYGSNMSMSRLKQRTPSAEKVGRFTLWQHKLTFNMLSTDGSGKCDAFFSGDKTDFVIGVVYQIPDHEKPHLDAAESLGESYNLKEVNLVADDGRHLTAQMYYAINFGEQLSPYEWYLKHVVTGAIENDFPIDYIERLRAIKATTDPDEHRAAEQLAVHFEAT